jgi:hypothetical protein
MSTEFKDRFKRQDIICSDRFHRGLCMIVESVGQSVFFKEEEGDVFRYKCTDLLREGQGWIAYEFDSTMDRPYDWRIATDEDIVKNLSRFVNPRSITLDYNLEFKIDEDDGGLTIGTPEYVFYVGLEDILKVKKFIDDNFKEGN